MSRCKKFVFASAKKKLALGALFFFTFIFNGFSADGGRKILPGHIISVTKHLTALGQLPATNQLQLAVGLPLRNEAALDELLRQLYDPASPNFHKFLSPSEFTARFGPAENDYLAVQNYLRTNGFNIIGTHGNRLVLDVRGKSGDAERAFHVALKKFHHPAEARDFFAPDTEPSVPTNFPIADIWGLSDFPRPHPNLVKKNVGGVAPKYGSGPDGFSYFGNDFRAAYVPGTALNGAGQTVGLVQFDGFYANDIATYATAAGGGRTNIPLQTVLLDGFSGTPTTGANSGNDEVSLDIEMAMAMAPGLSRIIVFEGSQANFFPNDVLNAMAASNTVKNLSSSWGWSGGPSTTTDNIFKTMAAQGQTYFNASGDSDAFPAGYVDNAGNTTTPSSSPYITQVGGTMLTTPGGGGVYSSETVWNRNNGIGSSGGVSTGYAIPSWQQGINSFLTNGGSTTARNIPDVALTAEYCYVNYGNGGGGSFGGTSCAAPLWAGFMALVNQQAVTNGQSSAGFINPAIYELANESIYNSAFHDITTGNNISTASSNAFYAVANYDLCTGLGTPNGTNLINALLNPDPLAVVANAGFNAVASPGGTFNISSQTFFVTNNSAASLMWSLINTSAWLNASSGGGSLAGGAGNPVVISLNTVASNLPAANYSTSLWFSNVTSGVAHSRFFTLTITDPLAILPATNFSFYGPSGGLFYPGSQNVIFTNQSAASQNWSLVNTSAWLSVASSSGSISGNGSVSVTIFTNAATAALANGTYSATLLLSNQASHVTHPFAFSALVGQSLVQNGGFETGGFTPWTLSGNSFSISVSASSNYVHAGTYGARATASGSFGYLSQNLATAPAQTYQFSFWFRSTSSSSGQQFQAAWNGTNIYSTASPPTVFTNQKFTVTATGTNTQIQFGFLTGNSPRIGLDDVTVTPVNLPSITQQPISQTNMLGSNVAFTAAASGTATLNYQWRTNGINLTNGSSVSGATTSTLTLTAISSTNAGNYSVVVTNAYGSITSSIVNLTVLVPAGIANSSLTNRTIQCGSNINTFSLTATGTAPISLQWNTNGVPVVGATNAIFALTNLHLFTVTNIAVVVTNLYGSATNSALLTIIDTQPPVLTLNGSNPFFLELGAAFTDPGATASDACAGIVSVTTNGAVNINSVGTNTLTYSAADGNGNTNFITRTVIVRDTTPPVISWSFTNLIAAANSNCVALMTNVTGTNFILASDLSGALTISQMPTNNFILPLGTNNVVITVADASGNKSYATNTIVIQDQAPPQILTQPPCLTNFIGTTATFNFAATACTPVTFQWYSNNIALPVFTNATLTLSNLAVSSAGNYFAVANANGGATTSAVITLTVNLYPPAITAAALDSNGGFDLNLAGSPGCTYVLEAKTNLFSGADWLPLATNTPGTNGVWQFTGTITNLPQNFYRLRLAQ